MPQDSSGRSAWVYSALVGMSLLLAGWLWQIVNLVRQDVQLLQDRKADKVAIEQKAGDRWTGSQQTEYKLYVDARFKEIERRIDGIDCRVNGVKSEDSCVSRSRP